MPHVVLATAGHIDHGKTELTRALTGIDTDRLPEEKARGITIDLGFAHFPLAGREVAIIDVPGHERFVKNMLAGVGGIDLALLIVAADESVMPQTREHLAILKLLGVPRGVVALTKRDLVDAEMLEVARAEAAEFVRGSFLEGARIVAVSARTGEGLEELRAALAATLAEVGPRDSSGPFRLHVDRAFSVKGFGSVVTGTAVAGRLEVGEELELSPGGRRVRVRGIEIHGQPVERVEAGSRAALNLAGVEREEIERGQQLLPPDRYPPASLADVRLRLLPEAPRLSDLARVRFHFGAGELLARVKLLDAAGPLEPRGEAWAQLRFERPLVLWPGDRFIVRSYSPMATIGGGEVVATRPEKHRGRAQELVVRLGALAGAAPAERLLRLAEGAGAAGVSVAELVAREGRIPAAIEAWIAASGELVRVESAAPRLFARKEWERLEAQALEQLRVFHAREPLRDGMSREELRARLPGEDAAVARQLLEGLVARGRVRVQGELAALAGHQVLVNPEERELMDELEQAFRKGGLSPEAARDVLGRLGPRAARAEKLLPVLVRTRRLVSLGGLYFHGEVLEDLKRKVAEKWPPGRPFSVPDFKDLSGTSRKFAIPLLEHLDATRFTRRVGDNRVVVTPATKG